MSIFGNTHAIGAAWIIQDRGSQLFRYLQVADNQDNLDIQRVLDEIQSYSGVLFELLRADELDKAEESDNECEGHESLNGDSMGESVQCDGSCITPTAPETGESVESPEKDKTPRFVAVTASGRILKKGDEIYTTRLNEVNTFTSVTHPRKVNSYTLDDPNGPKSWPNMSSNSYYASVFDLGIWDTQANEWSFRPENDMWGESSIDETADILYHTYKK